VDTVLGNPVAAATSFAGQVAVITGTSRGIGRQLAEHFLAAGALVVGVSRSPATLEHACYRHLQADASVEADAVTAMRTAYREAGRIDILVNNAGAASMNHTLLTPGSTAQRLMSTNFHSTFLMSREGARYMQRRRYGRIVNLSSVAVPLQLEGEAVYAASKAAIATFSEILAREVASFNITVNVVAPGPIATDLIRGVPAEKIQDVVERLALKRLLQPSDVANAVEFFCRPESSAITGQTLYLGGIA
jgi:3-oxoacyl-[acyl-carrier protein] reductase